MELYHYPKSYFKSLMLILYRPLESMTGMRILCSPDQVWVKCPLEVAKQA